MLVRRLLPVLVGAVLATLLSPVAARAQAAPTGVDCGLPESDAEALVILSNYYPGYWWDHTDLTVFVQAQPGISEEYLRAIDDAIATWAAVLEDCFDGLITLTQVDSRRDADIVVHYTAHAGGANFAGYAVCGDHGCPNILVSSEAPPSWGQEPYTPQMLGWVTLHELGHALGLGHATNLLESTDLMGYGWPDLGDRCCRTATWTRSRSCSPGRSRVPSPTRPPRAPTTARSTDAERLRRTGHPISTS